MGLFFRKSFKIGKGARLNLSKSGLGISGGVKGVRLSANSKGVTLYSGANGMYYREKIVSNSGSSSNGSVYKYSDKNSGASYKASILCDVKDKINGFINIEAKYAYKDLNNYLEFQKWLKTIYGFIFFLGFFTWFKSLLLIPVIHIINLHIRKKYKIQVNIDKTLEDANCIFNEIGDNEKFWDARNCCVVRIAQAEIKDYLEKFVPSIKIYNQTFYFLNEKLMLFDETKGVYFIPYSEISLSESETQAKIMNPPEDIEYISSTWEHPNKDGSPSKRYKINRKIADIKAYVIEISCSGNFSIPILVIKENVKNDLIGTLEKITGQKTEKIKEEEKHSNIPKEMLPDNWDFEQGSDKNTEDKEALFNEDYEAYREKYVDEDGFDIE